MISDIFFTFFDEDIKKQGSKVVGMICAAFLEMDWRAGQGTNAPCRDLHIYFFSKQNDHFGAVCAVSASRKMICCKTVLHL